MSEEPPKFGVRYVEFSDIPDVVNKRKKTRTFRSRAFVISDHEDIESAMVELEDLVREHGFTDKEVIRTYDSGFNMPFKGGD